MSASRLPPHEARIRWRAFAEAAAFAGGAAAALADERPLSDALVGTKGAHFPVEQRSAQDLALGAKFTAHAFLTADRYGRSLLGPCLKAHADVVERLLIDLGHRETQRSLVRAGAAL